MTKGIVSNWTPWYVDEPNNKVTCQICGDSFIKKDVRMLSQLGYANRNGQGVTSIKPCKNMKPKVARAFQGCGGMASTPLESTRIAAAAMQYEKRGTNMQGQSNI
jgi:hypothetical protein